MENGEDQKATQRNDVKPVILISIYQFGIAVLPFILSFVISQADAAACYTAIPLRGSRRNLCGADSNTMKSGSTYVHTFAIKGYYCSGMLEGLPKGPIFNLLMTIQKGEEAEKKINSKDFKTHYAGKPTKGYLKCIK